MERLSTYGVLGIPDTVATALVLVSLSLLLAPWFGGLELGPLKVPTVSARLQKFLRYGTPILFGVTMTAFYPAWPLDDKTPKPVELSELELRWLENFFGKTTWDGGDSWGTIVFDKTGRAAVYTNAPGRSGGTIKLLNGGVPGSGYILFSGEWKQDDGKDGQFDLLVSGYGNDAQVRWGPEKGITNDWKKQETSSN